MMTTGPRLANTGVGSLFTGAAVAQPDKTIYAILMLIVTAKTPTLPWARTPTPVETGTGVEAEVKTTVNDVTHSKEGAEKCPVS